MPISAMILRELERSRQILRGGDVLVPRFVVSTPEGELSIFADPSTDLEKDEGLLAKLYAFMLWKQASAFVMSSERQEPSAACSVGVSRPKVEGMMQAISRGPPVEFVAPSSNWNQNRLALSCWPCCRVGLRRSLPRPSRNWSKSSGQGED